MLSLEILRAHYAEYATRPDSRVQDRKIAKKSIIKYVLKEINFNPVGKPVRITVLGTSDKRYISIHQKVFEEVLRRNIKIITFDVDIKHLAGEDGIVLHDATEPFPETPFEIVFSHELMKFLTPEEQLKAIKNSHDALTDNGLAMHILHGPSIKGTKKLREWQYRVNPDELIKQLEENNIQAKKLVFNSETEIDWMRETTVIVTQK